MQQDLEAAVEAGVEEIVQHHAATGIFHDTNLWVAVSFALFAGVLWKFGKDAVLKALDSRIAAIKQEIGTAENLRIEAQELLAQYQRKQRDAEKEATRMLDEAKKSVTKIKKNAEKELSEIMERREKQLEERVERIKSDAVDEIRAYAADLAIAATREIIAEKMDKKAGEKLVDEAIKAVSKEAA